MDNLRRRITIPRPTDDYFSASESEPDVTSDVETDSVIELTSDDEDISSPVTPTIILPFQRNPIVRR
jgi:hypothetical protein